MSMAIVRADFEAGAGFWMNGYMPDGDKVYELLQGLPRGPPGGYDHIPGLDRTDHDVRVGYRLVLEGAREAFWPDHEPSMLILGRPTEESTLCGGDRDRLVDALGCRDQDHLVLATDRTDEGLEFMRLAASDYGFRQADLPDYESALKVWNGRGEPLPSPQQRHVFPEIVSLILEPYVDWLFDRHVASHRYFERLGFPVD